MGKNLIPYICGMLGISLYEEFKVVGDKVLNLLIFGKVSIKVLPWKPKFGNSYWTFWQGSDGIWHTAFSVWRKSPEDFARLAKGWVFHTEYDAKYRLPQIADELGVGYYIGKDDF